MLEPSSSGGPGVKELSTDESESGSSGFAEGDLLRGTSAGASDGSERGTGSSQDSSTESEATPSVGLSTGFPAWATRTPLMRMPLVLPRSRTTRESPTWARQQCRREILGDSS